MSNEECKVDDAWDWKPTISFDDAIRDSQEDYVSPKDYISETTIVPEAELETVEGMMARLVSDLPDDEGARKDDDDEPISELLKQGRKRGVLTEDSNFPDAFLNGCTTLYLPDKIQNESIPVLLNEMFFKRKTRDIEPVKIPIGGNTEDWQKKYPLTFGSETAKEKPIQEKAQEANQVAESPLWPLPSETCNIHMKKSKKKKKVPQYYTPKEIYDFKRYPILQK